MIFGKQGTSHLKAEISLTKLQLLASVWDILFLDNCRPTFCFCLVMFRSHFTVLSYNFAIHECRKALQFEYALMV